jgi:hypothetical protein
MALQEQQVLPDLQVMLVLLVLPVRLDQLVQTQLFLDQPEQLVLQDQQVQQVLMHLRLQQL